MAQPTSSTSATRRIPSSDISIVEATLDDLPKLVEGLYTCFSPEYWNRKEPPALRPKHDSTRHQSMLARLLPTFSHPQCHCIVARYTPTGEIIASGCWIAPGAPVHNMSRKDAVAFYGWESFFPDQEAFEGLWKHVDDSAWSGYFIKKDAERKEVLGDEPHWYLSSLFTWPEWQGLGAGRLLVEWACEQADKEDPVTPCYLESSPAGRKLYERCGFVKLGGEDNYIRRGPV